MAAANSSPQEFKGIALRILIWSKCFLVPALLLSWALSSNSAFSEPKPNSVGDPCNQIIVPRAWRVFSGDSFLVTAQEREAYQQRCLSGPKANYRSVDGLYKNFNAAVIAWLEGREDFSRSELHRLKKLQFEIAEVALALANKHIDQRQELLKKLTANGFKFAEIELAMNTPATKKTRDYIINILETPAVRGDAEAAMRLATMYLDGKSGPTNPRKADFYLDFASLSKNPEYVFISAIVYSNFPPLKNRQKFLNHLFRAAELGHEEALSLIIEAVVNQEISADIIKKSKSIICKEGNKTIFSKNKKYNNELKKTCIDS